MRSNSKVEADMAALKTLSRSEFAARWEKIYGHPPPKGMGRNLLELAAAWHFQRGAYGGVSLEARRQLNLAIADFEGQLGERRRRREDRRMASHAGLASKGKRDGSRPPEVPTSQSEDQPDGAGKTEQRKPRAALLPGTRLIREWQGRRHVVDIVPEGYVFDGKTYRSLSAVAKKITGTHWSGPRFFGL